MTVISYVNQLRKEKNIVHSLEINLVRGTFYFKKFTGNSQQTSSLDFLYK